MVRAHLSELGTRIQGVVREVLVDAGSHVRTGEVLLRLDDRHFRAELDRARAQHGALQARLRAERASLAQDRESLQWHIARAEAEVRRATASLQAAGTRSAEADAYHQAREALLPEQAISRETVRGAASQAATARALVAAAAAEQDVAIQALAETRQRTGELYVKEQRLAVLAAEVAEAAAAIARAEADLEATIIRAPADGSVIRRLAQPGMAVDVGTPTLSMWFTEEAWIEAWVDESDLADIAPGNPVRISTPALPGRTLEGEVTEVGLATDFEMPIDYLPQPRGERMQQSPLVGVAIAVKDMPALVRPGLSAVVNITRSQP
jgi:membrane fusion protein (multidrug efflux system)